MPPIAVPEGNHPSDPKEEAKPRLLHPILEKIPQEIRFSLAGLVSNVAFMVSYNTAIHLFHKSFEAATIYAAVYFLFIPVSHAISRLFVFGWPEQYVQNLLSNAPIGLFGIALGSACTAYFDKIHFNSQIEAIVNNIMGWPQEESDEGSEFYSSLAVTAITGIFSYLASVYVNSPSKATSDKKEL